MDKRLAHDRLGVRFAEVVSAYDTNRRLETLVDEFLGDIDLTNKNVLDVGCGLGFFSERLAQRGAKVTACDIGENLLKLTHQRVQCNTVKADVLHLQDLFAPGSFDVVLSSECIEHSGNPQRALCEMIAVLKPGGYLSVSTPNLLWEPIVKLTTLLRLRPYDGFEDFSTWRGIRDNLRKNGVVVEREKGLHLLPFQLPIHRLLRWSDSRLQALKWAMINICVLGRKIKE